MRKLLSVAAMISNAASAGSPPNAVDHQAAFCRGALRAALTAQVNTDNPTLLHALRDANAKLTSADTTLDAYLKSRRAFVDVAQLLAAEQEGIRAQNESAGAATKCLAGNGDLQSQATIACMERAAGRTDECVDPDFLPKP